MRRLTRDEEFEHAVWLAKQHPIAFIRGDVVPFRPLRKNEPSPRQPPPYQPPPAKPMRPAAEKLQRMASSAMRKDNPDPGELLKRALGGR